MRGTAEVICRAASRCLSMNAKAPAIRAVEKLRRIKAAPREQACLHVSHATMTNHSHVQLCTPFL